MLEMLQEVIKGLPAFKRWTETLERTGSAIVAEAEAGAGLVRVRADGRGRILAIHIDQELLRDPDPETLEEFLLAASNQALQEAREKFHAEVNRSFTNPDMFWSTMQELATLQQGGPASDDDPEERKRPQKRGGKKPRK